MKFNHIPYFITSDGHGVGVAHDVRAVRSPGLVGAIATKRADAQGCSKTSSCPSLAGARMMGEDGDAIWINGESMVNHMTQILDCDYRDYDHDSFDSQQNRWLNPWLAMPGFCGSFVSGNQWAHCASLDMERYGIAKARVLPLPVLES